MKHTPFRRRITWKNVVRKTHIVRSRSWYQQSDKLCRIRREFCTFALQCTSTCCRNRENLFGAAKYIGIVTTSAIPWVEAHGVSLGYGKNSCFKLRISDPDKGRAAKFYAREWQQTKQDITDKFLSSLLKRRHYFCPKRAGQWSFILLGRASVLALIFLVEHFR